MQEPTPEHPTDDQLRAYGEFAFLYLRSDFHRNVPMHRARLALQPPIDLMQFKLFHIDGIPRYGITWAHVSEAVEQKILRGEQLSPSEWRSGDRMWVMEIIAPYAQGTAAAAVHWLKRNLPETINEVRYLRVDAKSGLAKVIRVKRIEGKKWGTRVLPVKPEH